MGNTRPPALPSSSPAVHPHACGEHVFFPKLVEKLCGSSPRVWGTRFNAVTEAVHDRFIPTRVGNTASLKRLRGVYAVHPHACGEHQVSNEETIKAFGSSPRVWGTLFRVTGRITPIRFIPTRVGNTTAPRILARLNPVHPHACGEHVLFKYVIIINFGSSPRVWGTQNDSRAKNRWNRFIPTRVGNTLLLVHRHQPIPVHPHACGEHSYTQQVAALLAGSSPRVWGTPGSSATDCACQRFIPTRVGNTRDHTKTPN